MTNEAWALAAIVVALIFFIFYMAGLLREQRGRAMVAEQYAVDLKAQLSHMMKARTVEWNENDDSGVSVVLTAGQISAGDMDDWLDDHEGVNPMRERGGQG